MAPIIINRSDGVTAGTTFGANGNVTIAAPSSGVTLTVDTNANITGIQVANDGVNNSAILVSTTTAGDAYYRATTFGVSNWAWGNRRSDARSVLSQAADLSSPFLTASLAGNFAIAAPSSGTALTVAQTSGAGKQAGSFGVGLSTCYSVFSGILCIGTEGGDYPSVGYNWNPQSLGADNYYTADYSSRIKFNLGGFVFQTAPVGSGGTAITYTTRVTIAQTGLMTVTPGATNGELLATSAALTSGAGSSAGTLTNAPSVGNPTKWIKINDNGTIRSVPAW